MTNSTTHCESCGSTDREDLETGDQGYTACCNERVCYGDSTDRFGTPARNVSACCWAKAEPMFGPGGSPDGSCRLPYGT